jgi:hypothetical protein
MIDIGAGMRVRDVRRMSSGGGKMVRCGCGRPRDEKPFGR